MLPQVNWNSCQDRLVKIELLMSVKIPSKRSIGHDSLVFQKFRLVVLNVYIFYLFFQVIYNWLQFYREYYFSIDRAKLPKLNLFLPQSTQFEFQEIFFTKQNEKYTIRICRSAVFNLKAAVLNIIKLNFRKFSFFFW